MEFLDFDVVTTSATVHTGNCVFGGFLVGGDSINNPTITIYDNTSAAGDEVVPTATYDAEAEGLNGFSPVKPIRCRKGIYVERTLAAGAAEITVYYKGL